MTQGWLLIKIVATLDISMPIQTHHTDHSEPKKYI